MKWFKHDTDTVIDGKLKKVIMKYGAVGYAIYFHCLELIAGDICKTNITCQLEHDAEIIADNLKIMGDSSESGADKVSKIMSYMVELKLFDSVNSKIYCLKLLKRIDSSMLPANSQMRELIAKAKSESLGNNGKVMTKSCTSHGNVMPEENRIEHIILDDSIKATPTPSKKVKAKKEDRSSLPIYGIGLPVYISNEEMTKLKLRFDQRVIDDYIDRISTWQPKDGKRPANDYLTLLNWLRRDKVDELKTKSKKTCEHCGLEIELDYCRNPKCPQYC